MMNNSGLNKIHILNISKYNGILINMVKSRLMTDIINSLPIIIAELALITNIAINEKFGKEITIL